MKTLNLTSSVVLDPESSSAPAVVVYGGLYSWEGAWLAPKIPSDLKQTAIFVLPTHYTNDCATCLRELRAEISPDKISSYSLCGFSRGGIDVYKYWNLETWKILGLIDPSAPTMGGYEDTVLTASRTRSAACTGWRIGGAPIISQKSIASISIWSI